MTETVKIDSQHPEAEIIARAAAVLRAGRLVAFPTETVYGLGANALDPEAIGRVYLAKGRPSTDPLIAHIAQPEQLRLLAEEVPALAQVLGKRLWPGPLTLILKRNPRLPASLSAGRDTVAVRRPAHPVAAALIEAAGVPIAAPSANLFSRPSPTTAAHVLADLEGRVELILDGGPSTYGVESTVLDLTLPTPTILRPGGVTAETLRTLIPNLAITHRALAAHEPAAAPGQLARHYAPVAPLNLFIGPRSAVLDRMLLAAHHFVAENKKVALLLATSELPQFAEVQARIFDLGDDHETIARRLFTGLRQLDSQQPDVILAHDFGRTGLGLAIWDRLFRAAEGKVIEVNALE